MRAVLPYDPRQPASTPRIGELPDPVVGRDEVLIQVRATALNRADLLQLRGLYPPPPGESEVPGLECAGDVVAVGSSVEGWSVGDRVMALLAGGGQAERVACPAGQLMPIPPQLSYTDGAALPEAALTAWTNLVVEGHLENGKSVLITGATSGIGTFAVQLARCCGAEVVAAGRSLERLDLLRTLGATHCVVLADGMPEAVRNATEGRGADVAMDLVGGRWLPATLASLADGGRLILVGLMAGRRAELDLGEVLRRRLTLRGSVLRSRSRHEKRELVAGFRAFADERLADGSLMPVVDHVAPFDRIAAAYQHMADGSQLGKIVIEF